MSKPANLAKSALTPSPDDRVPPSNVEAEESILGAMMYLREAREYAGANLVPEDFYYDRNRVLFKVIVEMLRDGLEPVRT